MPNIYGDTRSVMKAIDKMSEEMEERRACPALPDEVQYAGRAWIFSHFDSRGGSMMTFDPHGLKAVQRYITDIFHGDLEDPYAAKVALEDLQGQFEVVVLGKPFEIKEDRDLIYDGDYLSYRLVSSYREHKTELDILVLVANLGTEEEQEERLDDYQEEEEDKFILEAESKFADGSPTGIVHQYYLRPWGLGEDACGLVIF